VGVEGIGKRLVAGPVSRWLAFIATPKLLVLNVAQDSGMECRMSAVITSAGLSLSL
jgi:hypothetical protein